MGEVIRREHVTNALHGNDRSRITSSSDRSWMRIVEEMVQQRCMVDHVVVASVVILVLMKDDEEEEDEEECVEEGMGEGEGEGSSIEDLVPKQAPTPQKTVPAVPNF